MANAKKDPDRFIVPIFVSVILFLFGGAYSLGFSNLSKLTANNAVIQNKFQKYAKAEELETLKDCVGKKVDKAELKEVIDKLNDYMDKQNAYMIDQVKIVTKIATKMNIDVE